MRRAEEVFSIVVELEPSQREARLAELCAGDQILEASVRSLLAADGDTGHWLDQPLVPAGAGEGEPIPAQVGSYRIIRLLGEGGMGRVYEAEQASPKRTIALKVIRPGLIHRSVLRRFEHEAAILGQLHHPGIAQVFEAGAVHTHAGRQPFIAMELIRGEPLDAFVRRVKPALRECLLLLAAVCDAVQHAHQMGVIHRDLKPGNILIEESPSSTAATRTDTSSVAGLLPWRPRIVDFGIARATAGPDQSTITLNTEPGAIVGTLGYMSPEQALGNSPVDTRSDVYSLGAILFEMLAGRLPIDVRSVPVAEAARRIRECEPEELGAAMPTLRGDVATIVAKALAKEPARRYASAGELGDDIRRHLADEPILARRASRTYLLTKFARRNKPLVAAAALVAVTLVAATVISTMLYVQARAARDAEIVQRRIAQRAADDAAALNNFLVDDLLRSASPERDGLNTTVVQVFHKAADSVGRRFAANPGLEAQARARLADVLQALGESKEAIEQARLTIELCDRMEPTLDPADTDLGTRLKMSRVLAVAASARARSVMRDFAAAEADARHALRLAAEPGLYSAAQTAQIRVVLGEALQVTGRHEEAERELRDAVAVLSASSGRDEANATLAAQSSLAAIYTAQNRTDDAISILQGMMATAKSASGASSPAFVAAANNLANIYMRLGRFDEALPITEEVVATVDRLYPENHPARFYANLTCASCMMRLGKFEQAELRALAALASAEKNFGPAAYETERVIDQLSAIYLRRDQADKAVPYHRRLLIARAWLSAPNETKTLAQTGTEYAKRMNRSAPGQLAANWPWFFEYIDTISPPGHARRTRVLANLAYVMMAMDAEDDALRALNLAWDASSASDSPEVNRFAASLLAAIHKRRGNTAEAERWERLAAPPH